MPERLIPPGLTTPPEPHPHQRQKDRDIYFNVRSHVPRPGPFNRCRRLLPHAGRAAVDVVCPNGFFIVQWNPATSALEVTDAADTGAEDRFGNMLPYDHGTGFFDMNCPGYTGDSFM